MISGDGRLDLKMRNLKVNNMPEGKTCLNCRFEPEWYPVKTAFGEYAGWCRWFEFKNPRPVAIDFEGVSHSNIYRDNPHNNCPAWEAKP